MSLAGFLWRYFRRYSTWAAGAAATAILAAALTGAAVSLIEPIFREVLLAGERTPTVLSSAAPEGEGEAALGGSAGLKLKVLLAEGYEGLKAALGVDEQSVVVFLPLLFVAIFLVRGVLIFVSSYSFQRIGLGATTDIRNDLYRSILSQSSRFHADHPSGELISRIVNDVAMMQSAVSNRVVDLIQQSATLVVLLWLLLDTHTRLAVYCLVLAPAVLYPIVRFGRGMRWSSHKSQERMADLANLVGEGVRGHRVVKAFGMEEFEDRRFRHATRRHLRVNLWAQMLSSLSSPVVESLAVVGTAALLVYAGRQIREGTLSTPLLIQFLFNLFALYDPVRKLNRVNLILQHSLAAAYRVLGVMRVPNEIDDRLGAGSLETVRTGLAFEGVSFAYGTQPVLREIDLEIRKGEVVALVGPSGAGKTTLVNLLPRFFDPDSGRVAIDGVDIRDVTLQSLRELIGIVTQETVLFNETVAHNIGYGRLDLSMERIREAAAAAYADEFIMQLPQGYETVIGEGGLFLSGGQRQRLAIARALVKNAPILILDEATSHLDAESEALVQKALYNLMQGRTTLVIAHRLATVMEADRIIVMESGRIVEQGTHEELIAEAGVYKRLYDLQFRE